MQFLRSLTPVLGALAAICSMASFVPQVAKIWREKAAGSVSLRMYAVTTVGFGLWAAYGALLRSWPLVASNLVCLALAGAILAMRLRFGAEKR